MTGVPLPSKAQRPNGSDGHSQRGQRGPKGAGGAPQSGAERSKAAPAPASVVGQTWAPTSGVDLDALFRRLHLANARRVWRELCRRAEGEGWTYQQLLEVLVSEETAHRRQTRLGRLCRAAQFPFLKTIDDFDFTFQSSLRLTMLGSFLSADFITEGRNLVLVGRTGRGKTHLAIALAYRAIQSGFDARFITAAALIDLLSSASREGRLREALHDWVHPAVLVVDEMGYLAYGNDAANLLFHVVNERHLKHRSMIFTTNKALKVWGQVLHDEDLGEAIVDRILERGTVLRLDGPSVRSRHVSPADLEAPDSAENQLASPARISGTDRPEFPEPAMARRFGSSRACRCPRVGHPFMLSVVTRSRRACRGARVRTRRACLSLCDKNARARGPLALRQAQRERVRGPARAG